VSPAEPVAFRIPQELIDRAEALVDLMATDPKVLALAGRPSRAAVLRWAIARGLDALEAEYRPASPS
jgi:hypothetical protein